MTRRPASEFPKEGDGMFNRGGAGRDVVGATSRENFSGETSVHVIVEYRPGWGSGARSDGNVNDVFVRIHHYIMLPTFFVDVDTVLHFKRRLPFICKGQGDLFSVLKNFRRLRHGQPSGSRESPNEGSGFGDDAFDAGAGGPRYGEGGGRHFGEGVSDCCRLEVRIRIRVGVGVNVGFGAGVGVDGIRAPSEEGGEEDEQGDEVSHGISSGPRVRVLMGGKNV